MRVYFAGAFSEGKTSLKNKVAIKYGLTPIPEQVRVISAEQEIISLEKLRADTAAVEKFQIEALHRQFESEKPYKNGLVSCRCIDNVAFLGFFGKRDSLYTLRKSETYLNYVEWLSEPDVEIFYILPQKKLISSDGFRDTDWELALQISGAVRMILEVEGLKYVPIHPLSAADRERLIFNYLDNVRQLPLVNVS